MQDPNQLYETYEKLIDNYKRDHFKRLKTMDHKFLHTAFHPKNSDIVICLEKNVYPEGLDFYNLNVKNGEPKSGLIEDASDPNIDTQK